MLITWMTVLGFAINLAQPFHHTDYEWCKYQLFQSAMPWSDAQAACAAVGKTLLRITQSTDHSFLTSLIKSSVTLMTRPGSNIEPTLWVGLHVDAAGNKRWGNCDAYNAAPGYDPIPPAHGSGCFLFDINKVNDQYTTDACHKSKQFICAANALDTSSCFKSTILNEKPHMDVHDGQAACVKVENLYYSCTSACVAIQSENGEGQCTMYTATSPTGRPGKTYYSKELLYYESIAVTATVSAQDMCSIAVGESTPVPPESSSLSTHVPLESSSLSSSMGINQQSTNIYTPDLTSTYSSINSSPGPQDATSDVCDASSVYTLNNYQSQTVCNCACGNVTNITITDEELAEKIKELREELILKKDDLSSWKRKLISVPDDRTSAKSIGYVGVIVLGSVFLSIAFIDIPRMILEIKNLSQALCAVKTKTRTSATSTKRRPNESNC